MNLLHIDSSALGAQSATRELSEAIVVRILDQHPGATLVRRDLDADPIPHLTAAALAGQDRDQVDLGDALITEFLGADTVVIGAPMYNFGIPSTLKAWIDRIAVAGRTFRYTAQGPEGLAGGRRVIVASARGSQYGDSHPADFQEAYLRQVFGFLGIQDVDVVRAEGLALSPQHRASAMQAAYGRIGAPRRQAA